MLAVEPHVQTLPSSLARAEHVDMEDALSEADLHVVLVGHTAFRSSHELRKAGQLRCVWGVAAVMNATETAAPADDDAAVGTVGACRHQPGREEKSRRWKAEADRLRDDLDRTAVELEAMQARVRALEAEAEVAQVRARTDAQVIRGLQERFEIVEELDLVPARPRPRSRGQVPGVGLSACPRPPGGSGARPDPAGRPTSYP